MKEKRIVKDVLDKEREEYKKREKEIFEQHVKKHKAQQKFIEELRISSDERINDMLHYITSGARLGVMIDIAKYLEQLFNKIQENHEEKKKIYQKGMEEEE